MSYNTISAGDLPELIREDRKVIDVRSPSEYRGEHVAGAELMPLNDFNGEVFSKQYGAKTPVYILCQSGKRASMAAKQLVASGHQAVFVVEGGTDAAKAAGVQIEYGKATISIERQVRIAAGGLVAIGVALGVYVDSGFLSIPALVGCGLVFAGITDTCGMGVMLSKMPWNR